MTPNELQAARDYLGLDVRSMARAMGVSFDTYRQWESGRRSMPAVAVRCVELLLANPRQAKRLAKG